VPLSKLSLTKLNIEHSTTLISLPARNLTLALGTLLLIIVLRTAHSIAATLGDASEGSVVLGAGFE
jgi:hypothetical protein